MSGDEQNTPVDDENTEGTEQSEDAKGPVLPPIARPNNPLSRPTDAIQRPGFRNPANSRTKAQKKAKKKR